MEEEKVIMQEEEINISNSIEVNSNLFSSIDFGTSFAAGFSRTDINNILERPMAYNKQARILSNLFYNSNGLLSNVVDYQVAMPTLANMVTVINSKKLNNYVIKKRDKIKDLSNKVGHKLVTRDIIRNNLLNGMFVGILRDTDDSVKPLLSHYNVELLDEIDALNVAEEIMIQPLNLDYCKVIGLSGAHMIAAFDMQYFDLFKAGGLINEIKNYPKSFVKGYNEYRKDSSKRWFPLDPYTTIVLKFKASRKEPYGRPYCLSALRDMNFSQRYEDDQYDLVQELASSIYYMTLPEGERKGTCSLNRTQQLALIEEFKSAIRTNVETKGKKISTLTLPPNTAVDRMTKDAALIKDTLSDENMKKTSTSLGFASSALNASSEGGASYASLQVNIDLVSSQVYQILDEISEEYTRVFNYYLFGEKTPSIKFSYLHVSALNKKDIFSQAKDLYTNASGSKRFLIESASFDSDSYLSAMREEQFENFDEEFKPHQTSFNSGGDDLSDSTGGRPSKDTSEMTNPSSVATKANGLNERGENA